MRILFAISILAFIALLWASIAIVQHVRRQRRRRRRFLDSTATLVSQSSTAPLGIAHLSPAQSIPELSFTDLAAPPPPPPPPPQETEAALADELPTETEAATSEPEATPALEVDVAPEPIAEAGTVSAAEVQPTVEPEPEPQRELEPEVSLATEEHLEAEAAPELETQPEIEQHYEPDFTPEPEITEIAEEQLETEAAPEPNIIASEPEAAPEQEPVQAAIPEPPPLVRPIRTGPPKHPLAQLVQPLHRPDWAYFNKDMGDLSDPEPRTDSRPKIRAFKPDSSS